MENSKNNSKYTQIYGRSEESRDELGFQREITQRWRDSSLEDIDLAGKLNDLTRTGQGGLRTTRIRP